MTRELPNSNNSKFNQSNIHFNTFPLLLLALLHDMASDKLTDEQKGTIDLYIDSYRDSTAKERKKVLKNLIQALFPKGMNGTQDEKDQRTENIKSIHPVCTTFHLNIWMLTTFFTGFDGSPGESCAKAKIQDTRLLCSILESVPGCRPWEEGGGGRLVSGTKWPPPGLQTVFWHVSECAFRLCEGFVSRGSGTIRNNGQRMDRTTSTGWTAAEVRSSIYFITIDINDSEWRKNMPMPTWNSLRSKCGCNSECECSYWPHTKIAWGASTLRSAAHHLYYSIPSWWFSTGMTLTMTWVEGRFQMSVRIGWRSRSWESGLDTLLLSWVGTLSNIYIGAHWQHVVDPENELSSDEEPASRRKKKVPIVLDADDDGTPLLPNTVADGTMTFEKLHPILREYLNCHYRESCVLMPFTSLTPKERYRVWISKSIGAMERCDQKPKWLHWRSISSHWLPTAKGAFKDEQDRDWNVAVVLVQTGTKQQGARRIPI